MTAGCQGNLGSDPQPAGGGQMTPAPAPMPPNINVPLPPSSPPSSAPPQMTPAPPVMAPPPPVMMPPPVLIPPPIETPPAPPMVMNPDPAPPPEVTPEPPAAPPPPAPPARPKLALLIVGNINDLDNGDDELADILDDLDFTVVLGDDNDEIEDAPTAGLVVISESADANQIGGEYRNFASPMVVMNSELFADMRMTSDNQNATGTTNSREVEIRKADHPLAAGLTGRVQISSQNTALHWGIPAATAVVVATLPGDNTRATIFSYEQGTTMQGQRAPAPRVGFFAGDDVTDRLNVDGVKLFEAAATWAWSH
jgi:hypothetical protein